MIRLLLWPFRWLLTVVLIGGVLLYRVLLRPLLPPLCRFQPSCSEYFILAVKKHGPVCGACKGVGARGVPCFGRIA